MVGPARLDVYGASRNALLSASSTDPGDPEALGERRLTCPDRETWLQAPPIVGATATNDGGIVVGRQSFAAKSLFHIQRLNQ
jgi:hypothetical protein